MNLDHFVNRTLSRDEVSGHQVVRSAAAPSHGFGIERWSQDSLQLLKKLRQNSLRRNALVGNAGCEASLFERPKRLPRPISARLLGLDPISGTVIVSVLQI
jgi:hypothetical protein